MFVVARLTKRIVLCSLMVMIASEAVSAMTRELSKISCNEAVEPGACVVKRFAKLMPPFFAVHKSAMARL
jgi:hypothetical protein